MDGVCCCNGCGFSANVVGELSAAVATDLGTLMGCPLCGGTILWTKDKLSPKYTMTPDELFGFVFGGEPLGEKPSGKIVAALLTTYRVSEVVLNGDAFVGLHLESGQYLDLSISQRGPYVSRILEKEE